MPEVIVAKTAGFCFGVSRAIDMVETELDKPGSQVCTLGPIVHNETVTDEMASRGVKAIEAPEEAAPGSTVVIRAHGVAESVEETLKNQGIKVVDATCPFVRKIHEIVKRESERGAVIIIVGNPDHPEVKGIAGRCSGIYHVVDSFEDFEKLKLPLDKTYSLVAQTTYNHEKLNEIIDKLNVLQYDIRCFNTVCNATYERQREAASIAARVDAMIVIGSRNSSNTRKLYEICKEKCNVTMLIQNLDDLTWADYHSVNSIGITAGASTPKHIIEEVQTYVRY